MTLANFSKSREASVLDHFTRQNRWWGNPANIEADRHLVRLRESRLTWLPPLPFQFDRDAMYTLRGPRQVGKSTILKRQVQALLASGWPARKILYLDVELAGLERARDLVAALREYLDGEQSPSSAENVRCAIFLDEVTRVDGWAGAIRGLIDNDELRHTTVVATGSHTRDLREGGERLPGRRGGGADLDLELLPLSFREYVSLVDPALTVPPIARTIAPLDLRAKARERDAGRPRLVSLFERYLTTGGYLTAINDEATYGSVRAETFQNYRQAIVGEFTRAGMRESYLRELVSWLASHLGQEFDYRDVAADTDIGSKDTARNYLDNLVSAYAAEVIHRTHDVNQPSPAFRGPKKIYPSDPLWWHLLRAWAAIDPDPWAAAVASVGSPTDVGHLVESVLAIHLNRSFGGRVFYWRPDDRREIDFVVATGSQQIVLAESKFQRTVDDQDVRTLIRAGGGLVLTRNWEGDLASGSIYALPAAEFLATLAAPSLAPSHDYGGPR